MSWYSVGFMLKEWPNPYSSFSLNKDKKEFYLVVISSCIIN